MSFRSSWRASAASVAISNPTCLLRQPGVGVGELVEPEPLNGLLAVSMIRFWFVLFREPIGQLAAVLRNAGNNDWPILTSVSSMFARRA